MARHLSYQLSSSLLLKGNIMSISDKNRDSQKQEGAEDDISWRKNLFLGSVFLMATGFTGSYFFLTNLESIEQAIPQQTVQNHPLSHEFRAQCIQERNDWENLAQLTNDKIASYMIGTQPQPIEYCVDSEARYDIAKTQDPDLNAGMHFWGYALALGLWATTMTGYGYARSRFDAKHQLGSGPQ